MWIFDETRALATRLDTRIAASSSTVADYRAHLVRTYGFEAPLESAFAYTSGLRSVCELHVRCGQLVHDLLALGMGPQQIAKLPQCSITPFADVVTAIGWLYVYERARLQHPLLCARITMRLPDVRHATDYFCRDEILVTERWNEVAAAIEHFAYTPERQNTIRDSACDAFQQAIEWYCDEPLRLAQ